MQQAARNILLSYCKRETTNSATQPDKPLKIAVQPVRTHYGHFKNIVLSQIESQKPPPKDNLALPSMRALASGGQGRQAKRRALQI